jgi:hypothetical protein
MIATTLPPPPGYLTVQHCATATFGTRYSSSEVICMTMQCERSRRPPRIPFKSEERRVATHS